MKKKEKAVYFYGYAQDEELKVLLYTPNLHLAKRRGMHNVAIQLTKEAK